MEFNDNLEYKYVKIEPNNNTFGKPIIFHWHKSWNTCDFIHCFSCGKIKREYADICPLCNICKCNVIEITIPPIPSTLKHENLKI